MKLATLQTLTRIGIAIAAGALAGLLSFAISQHVAISLATAAVAAVAVDNAQRKAGFV